MSGPTPLPRLVVYEVRDEPDDLPVICVIRRGRRRAARIGQPVLIHEVDDHYRERFIGSVDCPTARAPLSRARSLCRKGTRTSGKAGKGAGTAPRAGRRPSWNPWLVRPRP